MAGPALPPARMRFTPQVHVGSLVGCRFSVLLQGEPGSGKTNFMSTTPNPFFLVWDDNLGTHDKLGVRYSLVRQWAGEAEGWLEVIKQRRVSEVVGSKVDTLCLDTLSSLGNQISMELADGHAKLGSRDKWDEYYSRLNRILRVCAEVTKPDNAHPDRETYYIVAGVHEEPVYETQGEQKRLVKVKPTVAGRMANANELYSHFSAHFLCDFEDKLVEGGRKVRTFRLRTKPFGARYCMPDKIGAKELPETLPNNWPALMEAWGMELG